MKAHHAANRVVVRMHHDPAFVEAIHAAPAALLGPLGIPEELQRSILAVDRRAFLVDPQRRLRIVRTLADEFPGGTTLLLAATRRATPLLSFCSTRHFHDTVQQRGSLATAFAAHLTELLASTPALPPHAADVVRLEAHKARARRDLQAPPTLPAGHVACAPGVRADTYDGATLELLNVAERLLFELRLLPAAGLAEDGPALPATLPAPRPAAPLFLVTTPGAAELLLAEPGRVATLALRALTTPVPRGEALRLLRPLAGGASERLLAQLLESRLVSAGA